MVLNMKVIFPLNFIPQKQKIGEWKQNTQSGKGKLFYCNGDTIEGTFYFAKISN